MVLGETELLLKDVKLRGVVRQALFCAACCATLRMPLPHRHRCDVMCLWLCKSRNSIGGTRRGTLLFLAG